MYPAAAGRPYIVSPSSPSQLAYPPPASRPSASDRLGLKTTCQITGSSMAPASSRPLAATPTPIRVEDEGYRLPHFSSNPGDEELLRFLHGHLQRCRSTARTGVNAGVPHWDPWNIPGMPSDEGEDKIREKYFVTNCSALKSSSTNPATQTGYWRPRDLRWGIPAGERIGPPQIKGLKTTYEFHMGETIYEEEGKGTNWIMDVYSLIENGQVEDDLLMCHVFKGKSRDYVARPRCACTAHHHEPPKEKGIQGQSSNSLLESPGGLLATHMSSSKNLSPFHQQASMENVSPGSLAQHQGFLLANHISNQNTGGPNHQAIYDQGEAGGPSHQPFYDQGEAGKANHQPIYDQGEAGEPNHQATCNDALSPLPPLSPTKMQMMMDELSASIENSGDEITMEMTDDDMPKGVSSTVLASAENAPPGKRPKKSRAWERFTKLFTKARAVLAVCNHCYKVMTGDSSKGTSHLNRHKCPCNHC